MFGNELKNFGRQSKKCSWTRNLVDVKVGKSVVEFGDSKVQASAVEFGDIKVQASVVEFGDSKVKASGIHRDAW
jgi:hypothetical protein